MASITSNFSQVAAELNDLPGVLDLSEHGLGEDLLGIIVEGISDRSREETDPAGAQWAPNEPNYKARKGDKPVGVLSGEMLSLLELRGESRVTPDTLTVTYGTSEVTRERAEWFAEGGRTFWGLDPTIVDALRARCEEQIAARVKGR